MSETTRYFLESLDCEDPHRYGAAVHNYDKVYLRTLQAFNNYYDVWTLSVL